MFSRGVCHVQATYRLLLEGISLNRRILPVVRLALDGFPLAGFAVL